jgi:hypothetical protein
MWILFAAQGCARSTCLGKTNVGKVLDRINLLCVSGKKETGKVRVTIRCKNTFIYFVKKPSELGNKRR